MEAVYVVRNAYFNRTKISNYLILFINVYWFQVFRLLIKQIRLNFVLQRLSTVVYIENLYLQIIVMLVSYETKHFFI